MYTWTHAGAAWVVGRSLNGDKDNLVPWACVLGSIVPDIPLITPIFWNWTHGKPGETFISPAFAQLIPIAHSIPLWSIVGAILVIICRALFRHDSDVALRRLGAFLIGVLVLHIGLDIETHKAAVILGPDYLWPWNFHIGRILGVWTYRWVPSSYMPLWPEAVIDLALIFTIIQMEFSRAVAKFDDGLSLLPHNAVRLAK